MVRRISSGILVQKYLHDRMAKNIAPIHNWEIAMFSTVVLFLWSSLRTIIGRDFCCLTRDVWVSPTWELFGSGSLDGSWIGFIVFTLWMMFIGV